MVCEGTSLVRTYLALLPEEGGGAGRQKDERTLEQNSIEPSWAVTENKEFYSLLLAMVHTVEEYTKSRKQLHNNYAVSSPDSSYQGYASFQLCARTGHVGPCFHNLYEYPCFSRKD